MLGSISFAQTWNGSSWDAHAVLTNVGLDSDSAGQQWTFLLDGGTTVANGWSATVDATAMAAARNGDHVLWLDFQPGPEANTTRGFLVSSEYTGHALGLAQPGNGGGSAVVSPLSLGQWVAMSAGNGPSFSGQRASAAVDPAKPFWVVDFTTGLRAPAGATFLRDGWVADTASYPLVSVSIYFDGNSAGDRFTLHWQSPGQPEMVQSLLAAPGDTGWQEMGNWVWEDLSGTVCVTGSVGLGANYWITRDSDGWGCGMGAMGAFDPRPDPLRWSLRGVAAPPVPWQTVTFSIATGCGWSASVVQPGGTRYLTPTYSGTLTLPDADEWGNPHDFYYEEWTVEIDSREPYWLSVWGTQRSQGDTWFFNGWSAIGGAPRDMQAVTFGIDSGFRWAGPYVNQNSGSQYLTLSGQGYQIQDFTTEGEPNDFHYDLWNATVDVTRPFFLTVNGTTLDSNQTWFTNGWQWHGGVAANWQTLYFTIASGSGWWNSYVTQGNHSWALNYAGMGGYIEDYRNDGSGAPNFFYYDLFHAQVDMSRPFSLTVNGNVLDQDATAFYNGWTWQGGPSGTLFTLNFTVPSERATHDFTLTAPDHSAVTWSPNGWASSQWISFYNPWDASWWGMSGSLSNISQTLNWSGVGGLWTLTDTVTGENVQFDPSGAASYALDLSQWWLPATPIQFQVSLSRWGHDLRLRQKDGGEYFLTPGSSQGGLVQTPDGSWVESYYYFDATGYRRDMAGLDWWIYDATTGEYAPVNISDLTTWIYPLQPADVTAAQSGVGTVEVQWRLGFNTWNELLGGGFRIDRDESGNWVQLATGDASDFLLPQPDGTLLFHFSDAAAIGGATYRYQITYFYGCMDSTPAQSAEVTVLDEETYLRSIDSDGDGINDWEEIRQGSDRFDANSVPPSPVTAPDITITVGAGKSKTVAMPATGGSKAPLDVFIVGGDMLGTFSLNGTNVTFTATILTTGSQDYAYMASDGRTVAGNPIPESWAIGIIHVVVMAPVTASSPGGTCEEDTSVTIPIAAEGGKGIGYGYTIISIQSQLAFASIYDNGIDPATGKGSASLVYMPGPGFTGTDTLQVEVADSDDPDNSTILTVTVTVTPPVDPPPPPPPDDPPPDGVAIGFGPKMKGVVGDEIPSILETGGKRHFVSPKKTTALPDENVVLKALVNSSEGKTFEELYEWFVDGGSWGNSSTLYLPRSAAGKRVVTIRKQVDGQVMDSMIVWIVWATQQPPRVPTAPLFEQAVAGVDGQVRSVFGIQENDPWTFKWSIEPVAIFDLSDDVPKLNVDAHKAPPGAYQGYQPKPAKGKQDDAPKQWDVSRRMRVDVYDPGISFSQLADEYQQVWPQNTNGSSRALDFPTDDVTDPKGNADAAGNDDPRDNKSQGGESEDDDPYHARQKAPPDHWLNHAVGQVTSYDRPRFPVRNSWTSNPYLPYTFFHWRASFFEFVRLELWDGARTEGKFWFRISDELKWHHELKVFRLLYGADWLDVGSHSGLGNAP